MTRFWCSAVVLGLGCGFFSSASANGQEAVDFHDDIFPFIEARCFKCHSSEKQKGDLRLDSPAWIERGSENGEVLIPGEPEESPLYYLTNYPEDDPDYMPSKGKGLTDTERELLKRWIAEGADFGDEAGGSMMMAVSGPPAAKKKYTEDEPLPPASYELSAGVAERVKTLEALGLHFDTVNHDAQFLEVTYTYSENAEAFDLSLLEPISSSIVKLNFGRSIVRDEDLVGMERFADLVYLDLRNSKVSDAALGRLAKLSSLEYLNLHSVQVTDAGLAKLRPLKRLRKLYLWGTGVTDEGVASLREAIPGLIVIR